MSDTMKLHASLEQMRAARRQLGNPASLNEALVATGIDAFFHLMDGGAVESDGRKLKLETTDGH